MLVKVIINKKITIPGKFVGFHGSPAVTCSHKAAQGFIYPLERGFIYIYKPPIFIRY
jgi:structure-specific recognition protein 1